MPTTKLKNTLYRMMLPLCSPGCGKSPVNTVTGHKLTTGHKLIKLLKKHHVLGSAVLVSSDDQQSLICTSSESPMHVARPDTYFRVASITKTATAVLALKLIDDQILDPDRPVRDIFGMSSEANLKGITLCHLLSHTSGLTDPPDLESILEEGMPFTDILSNIRRYPAGHSFHYSNFGFGLIGCIMEAVLGMPVGQIFSELLFKPLHMNATLEGCLLPSCQIMPVTRILPYHKDHDLILTRLGSRPLYEPDPLRHYGHTAGSMYTDILSLQKLLDVLSDKGLNFLSDSMLHTMKSEHATYGKISPGLSYGFGLLRIHDPSLSDSLILGHQGFAYGCADGAFWEEKTGRSMIMLNGGSSEARIGRLGLLNRDMLHWSLKEELPSW